MGNCIHILTPVQQYFPFEQCIVKIDSMRDVHLREVDLNLLTLLEERHVTHAAKRRLTDVHALRSMIASLRAALDDLYAVPASWL